MTVLDNVAYGLRVRGVGKAERRERAARGAAPGARCAAWRSAGPPSCRAASGSGSHSPARSSIDPARAAARRAARRARPQAARADAGRAQGDPARGRHHLRLRHPRPGGGAHDERPGRGLRQGPDRAGRRAARHLRAPGLALRGPLRRHLQPHRRQRGAHPDGTGGPLLGASREDRPAHRADHPRGLGGLAGGRRGRRRAARRGRVRRCGDPLPRRHRRRGAADLRDLEPPHLRRPRGPWGPGAARVRP